MIFILFVMMRKPTVIFVLPTMDIVKIRIHNKMDNYFLMDSLILYIEMKIAAI